MDSHLMVQYKSGDSKEVLCDSRPLVRLARQAKMVLDTLPVRLHPNKPVYNFTPAMLPQGMTGEVEAADPDILHLHWLAAGYLRIETLKRFRKPLVWTLHDSWAFTGGCHVPFDCVRYRERCGACPVLGSLKERDLSRRVWERKEKSWRDLKMTVVAPSRWMAGCAKSSALFGDVRVEVIPNGLDLTLFKPVDKRLARDLLCLPQGKKIILFGAVGATSDRNKGYHLLSPALEKLAAKGWKDTAELVVFGASEPAFGPPFEMKTRYLGRVHDDTSLVLLYAAADVFVAPSILESFSLTVLEAMACGTPCIAFNKGGVLDLIVHGRTGYLAHPYEPEDLAACIGGLLEDDAARQEMARRSRRKVEEEFAIDKVSRRYVDLYRGILA
jgi:glycosyltransferase involved in cell wall biosynthesis